MQPIDERAHLDYKIISKLIIYSTLYCKVPFVLYLCGRFRFFYEKAVCYYLAIRLLQLPGLIFRLSTPFVSS
jgi:hypothetical protein